MSRQGTLFDIAQQEQIPRARKGPAPKPRPVLTCLFCGKKFQRKAWSKFLEGKVKFCSMQCSCKARNTSPAMREKVRVFAKKRRHSEETRAKMSAVRTGKTASEGTRKKLSETKKRLFADPVERKRLSLQSKTAWKNPALRARMTGSNHPRWKFDRADLLARKRVRNIASRLICRILGGKMRFGQCEKVLGYTETALRTHLESRFLSGMTWENYGVHGWHVDHIRPLCSFPLGTPIQEINALSNLQPLWAKDNSSKGGKWKGAVS